MIDALALGDGAEPRIDTRLMAQELGNQHRPVIALIDKYLGHFERFGKVLFEKAVGARIQGGGNPERFALLNEDQCYFLLSLSRNTDQVVDLKVKLVRAFREARQSRDVLNLEYLPTYHALHDQIEALAAESQNKKFVHMNVNKLVNKTVGIAAGSRPSLPFPKRSLIATAQTLASNAMQGAHDHHDGYDRAKEVLGTLGKALMLSQKGEAQAGESARASMKTHPVKKVRTSHVEG